MYEREHVSHEGMDEKRKKETMCQMRVMMRNARDHVSNEGNNEKRNKKTCTQYA